MNLTTSYEDHKRDEEYDKQEIARDIARNRDIDGRVKHADVLRIARALDALQHVLCGAVQREYLYEKAIRNETHVGINLRYALDSLVECTRNVTAALDAVETR